MREKIYKAVSSVVIAGLLLAHLAMHVSPASASPWTPLAWQNGGKLRNWIWDTNGNFVDDQIDNIAAADPNQRVKIVVDFNRCLNSSPGAIAFIESLGGILVYQAKFVTYAIYDNIRAGDAAAIGARPEVAMVEMSQTGTWLDVERQAMRVEASGAHSSLESDFGWPATLNGSGVNIAILDTGVVNAGHPDFPAELAGRASGFGYDTFTHTDTDPEHTDQSHHGLPFGHGTEMAAIAVGTGAYGVAPGAQFVDIKVMDDTGWTEERVSEALDVVLLHREDWNIRVVNLSFGSSRPSDGQGALSQHVNKVAASGIVVVAGAGNGPDRHPDIGQPGAASWAITVGAADPGITADRSDDAIAFSTHGPRPDDGDAEWLDEMKPELATSSGYGTSSAAARTSGLAALLIQLEGSINPGSLKDLLIRTAEDKPGAHPDAGNYPADTPTWNADWGFGYTDAYAAVNAREDAQAQLTDLTFIGCDGSPHPTDPWETTAVWTDSMHDDREWPRIGVPDKIHACIRNNGEYTARKVPINFGVYDYTAGVRVFYDVGAIVVDEIPPMDPGDAPLDVAIDWVPQELEDGEHGCALVTINYGLDSNYAGMSNRAQRNLHIRRTGSPAVFNFRVENPLMELAKIHLAVETVQGGDGWTWTLSANDFVLHPWQDCPRHVTLTVTPPPGALPGDRAAFNVSAIATTKSGAVRLIGGVRAEAYVPCYDLVGPAKVGVEDVQAVASRWRDPARFEFRYDVVPDGVINIRDILKVAAHWGEMCP